MTREKWEDKIMKYVGK